MAATALKSEALSDQTGEDKTSCALEINRDILPNGTAMTTLDFQDLRLLQVTEKVNGKPTEIIQFEGKITNSNSFNVNRKIYRIFEADNYNLILDLSKLEYVNSSGVAMLFSIFHRVKENSGKIVIGGVHPFLYNIFNLMDLPPQMDIYDTLDEAKKIF